MSQIERVKKLISTVTAKLFYKEFSYRVDFDQKSDHGRVFIQVVYTSTCNQTGELKDWYGRKWYLSDHMTDDEIIKTAWCAFEAAVKHEVMEGFKVDGKVLFNPHTPYTTLLTVSDNEVKREAETV